MKQTYKLQQFHSTFLFFIPMLMVVHFSCKTNQDHFDSKKWYEDTKRLIIEQSNIIPDSTWSEYYDDGNIRLVKFLNNGRIVIQKQYRKTGQPIGEINFSSDGLFEFRKEICQDGYISFEGLFYKGEAYGLSRWWNCDKSKIQEGIRFKSRQIGVWKKWDAIGKVTEIDYKNDNLIDSLESIKLLNNQK